MATIIPFKAIRPTRDKVSLLASRSYESYTQEQVEARLRDNPFSFLQIVNPGFKYQKELTGESRYQLVKNRYQEFKEDGIFLEEKKPSFYLYKIINREENVFHGVVAAASIKDYEEDFIKKHEHTLSQKEELFKEYLKTVGFNAEAVLLTYPDQTELNELFKKIMQKRAEYEFTTTYRDTHYLWVIDQEEIVKKITQIFSNINAIYIADGHHRTASSYLLGKEMNNEKFKYFMSFLIPESELKIFEYNRLVKDLNGLEKEEFLVALDHFFRIEKRGEEYYKPSKKHHFSMYLEGDFYSLYLRKDRYKFNNALEALDTHILYAKVLQPILGINDPRNDDRIGYAHGKRDLAYVKAQVDSNAYKVGFGLVPITVEEIKEVANQGLKMPPKSTYIEPKLRSGVTIYEF